MYQHCIRTVDEKHKNDLQREHRRTGNDILGGKPTVTIQADYDNMEEVLEVIIGRSLVPKGCRDIIVVGNHRLDVIGELRKDTAEKYNRTRDIIDVFINVGRLNSVVFQ